jgi:hypothetical protein
MRLTTPKSWHVQGRRKVGGLELDWDVDWDWDWDSKYLAGCEEGMCAT